MPPQWTHAGPVALANALWWLDSVAEPHPVSPPTVNDGHALVAAYPYFGPARDDHVAENLTLLVEDLSLRAHTNGVGLPDPVRGTLWHDLVAAAHDYVDDRRLSDAYEFTTSERPTLSWIDDAARRGSAAVLLLGVWERQAGGWRRVGGHYVSLAGVGASEGWVAFSDPLLDAAAHGGSGRTVPVEPSYHSCREGPRQHDDVRIIAHDRYDVYDVPGLPVGTLGLAGYFTPASFGDAAAFRDQNAAGFLKDHAGTWSKGSVVMAIDAGLTIAPKLPGVPTASRTAPAETPQAFTATPATPMATPPPPRTTPATAPTALASSTVPPTSTALTTATPDAVTRTAKPTPANWQAVMPFAIR